MSVGIVILEIPSNLILYKLGPRLWLGLQVFAWSVSTMTPDEWVPILPSFFSQLTSRVSRGLVATFQSFQKGLGPFFATRFLLGYACSLGVLLCWGLCCPPAAWAIC